MTMAEIKKMQKKLALLEEENIILKKQWLSSQGNPGKSRTDLPGFQRDILSTSVQSFEGSQKHILQHFKP